MKDGIPHGKGTMTMLDSSVYEATWIEGKLFG